MDGGAVDFARGEKTRPRVNDCVVPVKTEGRLDFGEGEIGFEKGADRPDIFPVALEDVRLDAPVRDGGGDDVFAEVVEIVFEAAGEDRAVEQVNANGGLVAFGVGRKAEFGEEGGGNAQAL